MRPATPWVRDRTHCRPLRVFPVSALASWHAIAQGSLQRLACALETALVHHLARHGDGRTLVALLEAEAGPDVNAIGQSPALHVPDQTVQQVLRTPGDAFGAHADADTKLLLGTLAR